MNVLDNSTQKGAFLKMYSKCMFGLILCGIQSVGQLKALYTLHPDIPVHSDTNSTSLESIQLVANTTLRLFTQLFAAMYFIQLSELGVVDSVLPRLLLQGAAPCPIFVTPCPFEKAEMTPCPFD